MDTSKIMDIIAYFLSEYDMDAVDALGYDNRTEAFRKIAGKFGKKETYLKRLRDEYDVVTTSERNGQRNRAPRQRITDTKNNLNAFSFDELLAIVQALLENTAVDIDYSEVLDKEYNVRDFTEEEIEHLINFKDSDARIKKINTTSNQRVYNTSIIKQLKKLYKGKCQICGCSPFEVDISEVHHIAYFSESNNNDTTNLLVLCPNHHRKIHKLKPVFNYKMLTFVYDDGTEENLRLNYHLSGE